MALHNTQCPHCFTTYVISDEQLRVSEGMVRCGTCRGRFQARLLKNETQTPRFDPREAFIEPISEELEAQKQAASELLADTAPQEFSFADPHTETQKSVTLSEQTISAGADSSLGADGLPRSPEIDSNTLSAEEMLANIRAKQQADPENDLDKDNAESDQLAQPTVDNTQNTDEEALIDQVNSLVDDKLINSSNTTAAADINVDADDDESEQPFQLDRKPTVKSRAWLIAPPLLVILIALSAALIYQLWMKQIVVFKDNSFAQKKILQLSIPVVKKLAEYDVVLPMRRNLSQLEIASARTEAHPTRPSTTLLRISIINHAEFEQPLPWLEMTLTDADGRLVSRRSLTPLDYVYQNATNNLIGARELKKVTIELLSFPKQATGYELKILNK